MGKQQSLFGIWVLTLASDYHFIAERPQVNHPSAKRPRAKRPRAKSRPAEHAKPQQFVSNCGDCRKLYKGIECLHKRVMVMEQIIGRLGGEHYLKTAFGGGGGGGLAAQGY